MFLGWRVERICLSKAKTQLRYISFLTFDGYPAAAFNHRLCDRSVPDLPRPHYIFRLIAKVITVSLGTAAIAQAFSGLGVKLK